MTRTGYFVRLGISVFIDLFDLLVGWAPVLGTIEDGIGSIAVFALWGKPGLFYIWEVVDVFDATDAFVPTATMIGLYVGWKEGYLLGKKSAA